MYSSRTQDPRAQRRQGLTWADHESMNVVQSPAPKPASSTANPGSLVEPSSVDLFSFAANLFLSVQLELS
jgi:hypothetical protein